MQKSSFLTSITYSLTPSMINLVGIEDGCFMKVIYLEVERNQRLENCPQVFRSLFHLDLFLVRKWDSRNRPVKWTLSYCCFVTLKKKQSVKYYLFCVSVPSYQKFGSSRPELSKWLLHNNSLWVWRFLRNFVKKNRRLWQSWRSIYRKSCSDVSFFIRRWKALISKNNLFKRFH